MIVFDMRTQLGRLDHRVHQGHLGHPDNKEQLVLQDQ